MKKYVLFYVTALITLSALLTASCKKIIHSNDPTPNNVRMVAYNKITTIEGTVPVSIPSAKITESFRFYYDESNRVSQIIYTGNDSFEIFKRIDFSYKNDTIFKKITDVLKNIVVERDTFIKNSEGAIVTAYFLGYDTTSVKYNYEYYGKLLSRITKTATNWNHISMNSQATYTSVNGDWLKQTPEGKLNLSFSNLTPGLDVDWIQTTKKYGHIEDLMSNDYTFTGDYSYSKDMFIWVQDTLQDTSALLYPAWDWSNESYQFYTENALRTGDWLQLQSFTTYGQNIYRNSHLVESIAAGNKNAYITYRYDAESKIVQTTAVVVDSLLNKNTYTYDIQYEEY